MIKHKKFHSRKQLMKICKEWGLTNVELFYHKSEGWTIYSDQFNDWISMDSEGFVLFGNRKFNKNS